MSVDLSNVVAIQNEKQESVIGYLTWHSLGQQLIQRDELRRKLNEAGLDSGWLPNEIRPSDAFRRATKEVESKTSVPENGVFKNYLVREVFSDKKTVHRKIVCETVDPKGRRLDYNESAILTLDKVSNQFDFVSFDDVARNLAREAEERFFLYRDNYAAPHIRAMIMWILKSLSPTPVRPHGGVYFIPSAHARQLGRLCRFVSELENGEAFQVPLLNTHDNRQMIYEKLKQHLEKVLGECHSGMNGNLTKSQLKETIEEAKRIIKDYRYYKTVVTEDVDKIEQSVSMLHGSVAEMMASL
ncbi:MAG TPA: DUF6744 family protein [Bacillales bacterium]